MMVKRKTRIVYKVYFPYLFKLWINCKIIQKIVEQEEEEEEE